MGLEDNKIKNRKANDCVILGRDSGLQRSDKETTRIAQTER